MLLRDHILFDGLSCALYLRDKYKPKIIHHFFNALNDIEEIYYNSTDQIVRGFALGIYETSWLTLLTLKAIEHKLNDDLAQYQRLHSSTTHQEDTENNNSFKQAHFVRSLNYLLSRFNATNHDKSTIAKLAYYIAFGKIANERKDFNTLLNAISSKEVKPSTENEMKSIINTFITTLTSIKN